MFERNENTFLRLANIGYYANKYVFSDKLNATVISSDGRPLPETLILDTLTIFPGERYGVLVNSSTLDDDSIQIEYLNLNTLSAEGTEYIRYQVVEELSANTLSPAWLQVFPNPFTSSLKLRNLGNEDIRNIAIYTLSGQLVYTDAAKYNSSVVLQLGHLAAGSYLIQVTTESGNKIRRKLHKF
jgi:FtsP/CotA-like multicopper oxidase with cupredoxin domain